MTSPIVSLRPESDPATAAALVALQRRAYAIEERLIGHAVPARTEAPAALAAAGLRWWAWREGSELRGAVAVSATPEWVDLERLVVAPEAARRGIGAALVAHVLREAAARPVVVATGRDNYPARQLYARAGFTAVDEVEVTSGLWVTCYTRGPGTPSHPP